MLDSVSMTEPNSGVATDVRGTILRSDTANPAIQRLQARIRAGSDNGALITSYDRMHHRHNRS
ncbi:YhhA family cyclophane-containing RiPP [Azospirillum sp. sgz302134]